MLRQQQRCRCENSGKRTHPCALGGAIRCIGIVASIERPDDARGDALAKGDRDNLTGGNVSGQRIRYMIGQEWGARIEKWRGLWYQYLRAHPLFASLPTQISLSPVIMAAGSGRQQLSGPNAMPVR